MNPLLTFVKEEIFSLQITDDKHYLVNINSEKEIEGVHFFTFYIVLLGPNLALSELTWWIRDFKSHCSKFSQELGKDNLKRYSENFRRQRHKYKRVLKGAQNGSVIT